MADLEVRILRTLVALAEEGAMSRAAHRLHISQPALSKQLAQAEQLTGLRLFERHTRGSRRHLQAGFWSTAPAPCSGRSTPSPRPPSAPAAT